MKEIKPILVLFAAIIFLCSPLVSAIAQYQQVNTSKGKVIVGLDREKAYRIFGAPASMGNGLWYYAGPPGFFVYFSESPIILLYPNFYQATVGIPLELKAFLSLPDLQIRDITEEVQLVFDKPEYVKLQRPGVIIPKKAGEYQVLAIYKKLLSSPLYMQVKESKESGQKEKEKEKLLSIDILPYRPVVTPQGWLDFVALGTIFDYVLNKYTVKEISLGATWFMRQRGGIAWSRERGRRLFFPEKGEAETLCRYKEIESSLQRVEIKDKVDFWGTKLRHLLILPEVTIVPLDSNMNLKVFGTYYNNSVQELTREVGWRIRDADILEPTGEGEFFAKSEGVTEITAMKEGVEGLPVKVVVVNRSGHFFDAGAIDSLYQKEAPNQNTLAEIRDDVDKLKKVFLVKKKELTAIKITPGFLDMALGEQGKLSATGIYSDGGQADLTSLGRWGSLNRNVATVSGGNVSSVSVGETSAYVEFKSVRSEYAKVVVGGPDLVSLSLTPQSLKIPRHEKANVKAEGYYSDHSQRDITALVSWGIEGPVVVKVEKGIVRPLKFGRAKIYAEYAQIKSNTADVDVILTMGWLLWMAAKGTFILILCMLFVFFVLYLLMENKRKQLLLLKHKPREFILSLYENATGLITIFGLRHDVYTPPLSYAELVKKKFPVENNAFLNFSIKFEEAKYSQHILQDNDAVTAMNDYNNFFERLCKNQSRIYSLYKYCLALVHRRPIFIISTATST